MCPEHLPPILMLDQLIASNCHFSCILAASPSPLVSSSIYIKGAEALLSCLPCSCSFPSSHTSLLASWLTPASGPWQLLLLAGMRFSQIFVSFLSSFKMLLSCHPLDENFLGLEIKNFYSPSSNLYTFPPFNLLGTYYYLLYYIFFTF